MRFSASLRLIISLRTVIGGVVDALLLFASRSTAATTTATQYVLYPSFPPATTLLQSTPLHRPPNSRRQRLAMAPSSKPAATAAAKKQQRHYPPSRAVIDPATNEKWRLCAAAAVLRPTDGALLVGERRRRFGGGGGAVKSGSWQCPQGGVDGMDPQSAESPARRERPETLREAAARELYEEMGLVVGRHVEYLQDDDEVNVSWSSPRPLRYSTQGTGSWLQRQGFAGQELHWVLFRCISDECNSDPKSVCNLSGLNGERPEFTDVRWETVDKVAEAVWEKKRGPYVALAEFLRKKKKEEEEIGS